MVRDGELVHNEGDTNLRVWRMCNDQTEGGEEMVEGEQVARVNDSHTPTASLSCHLPTPSCTSR